MFAEHDDQNKGRDLLDLEEIRYMLKNIGASYNILKKFQKVVEAREEIRVITLLHNIWNGISFKIILAFFILASFNVISPHN